MTKKHSILKALILSISIFVLFSMTAFAANAKCTNYRFSWKNSFTYVSPTFSANSGNIYLEGVATSTNNGTFQITMEKKGFWGWSTVGNQYTINCGVGWTRNTRTNRDVQGQYFKRVWPNGAGTYRFKLTRLSGPIQDVGFTQVYWFSE